MTLHRPVALYSFHMMFNVQNFSEIFLVIWVLRTSSRRVGILRSDWVSGGRTSDADVELRLSCSLLSVISGNAECAACLWCALYCDHRPGDDGVQGIIGRHPGVYSGVYHCNTLNILQHTVLTATRCNALQHAATRCNTLSGMHLTLQSHPQIMVCKA